VHCNDDKHPDRKYDGPPLFKFTKKSSAITTNTSKTTKDHVNIQLSCTESFVITRNSCSTSKCEELYKQGRSDNYNYISEDEPGRYRSKKDEEKEIKYYKDKIAAPTSKHHDNYNPRESLARNYAITFDRRVRYIRVCENKACEPLLSYVIDLNQINQTLQRSALHDSMVYRLEGRTSLNDLQETQDTHERINQDIVETTENFSDEGVLTPYTLKITTVLHAKVPINTQLTTSYITELIKTGHIKVYVQTPDKVRDIFTLHKCTIVKWIDAFHSRNHDGNWVSKVLKSVMCDDIAWPTNVDDPIVESNEENIIVQFRYLSNKAIADNVVLASKKQEEDGKKQLKQAKQDDFKFINAEEKRKKEEYEKYKKE
jgi:hypothetical protein